VNLLSQTDALNALAWLEQRTPGLYEEEELAGSPNNVWPDDRSWLTFTDEDLWATKVSGGAELVDRLIADTELETVLLPF
jgi:hypothetical protein